MFHNQKNILDILLVLKEIKEFTISRNNKKTFEFNIRN